MTDFSASMMLLSLYEYVVTFSVRVCCDFLCEYVVTDFSASMLLLSVRVCCDFLCTSML